MYWGGMTLEQPPQTGSIGGFGQGQLGQVGRFRNLHCLPGQSQCLGNSILVQCQTGGQGQELGPALALTAPLRRFFHLMLGQTGLNVSL